MSRSNQLRSKTLLVSCPRSNQAEPNRQAGRSETVYSIGMADRIRTPTLMSLPLCPRPSQTCRGYIRLGNQPASWLDPSESRAEGQIRSRTSCMICTITTSWPSLLFSTLSRQLLRAVFVSDMARSITRKHAKQSSLVEVVLFHVAYPTVRGETC